MMSRVICLTTDKVFYPINIIDKIKDFEESATTVKLRYIRYSGNIKSVELVNLT